MPNSDTSGCLVGKLTVLVNLLVGRDVLLPDPLGDLERARDVDDLVSRDDGEDRGRLVVEDDGEGIS